MSEPTDKASEPTTVAPAAPGQRPLPSVRGQLLRRLILVAASFLLLAAAGVGFLAESRRSVGTIFDDRLVPISQMREIANAFGFGIAASVHGALAGRLAPAEAAARVEAALALIDDRWTRYLATYLVAAERAEIEQIAGGGGVIEPRLQVLPVILRSGDLNSLADFARSGMIDAIDPVVVRLNRLIAINESIALEERRSVERNVTAFIGVFAGLVLIVALALAGAWLSLNHDLLRPLRGLVRATRRLGQGAAPEDPPAVRSREIAALWDAHALATRALAGREAERRRAAALQREAEQAQIAREVAERANATKSEFLANMSHELRTPLNAILGFAEVLAMLRPSGRQLEDYAAYIQTAGRELLDHINAILEHSRLSANEAPPVLAPVDLHDFVTACEPVWRGAALRKEVGVRIEIREPVVVQGDELMLRSLLNNLMSNAIKFAPAGSDIDLTVGVADHRPYLEVRDRGPGMDAKQVPRAMQPFQQVEATMTKRNAGVGLGLAIAKRAADLHGAQFEIDTGPGEGLRARVRFPDPVTPAAVAG